MAENLEVREPDEQEENPPTETEVPSDQELEETPEEEEEEPLDEDELAMAHEESAAKDAEIAKLREMVPFDEDQRLEVERLRENEARLVRENRRFKTKEYKQQALKKYPDADPDMVIGNSRKELFANARKSQKLIKRVRAEAEVKYKAEAEAHKKKQWEDIPEGGGSQPVITEREEKLGPIARATNALSAQLHKEGRFGTSRKK
jgi:nucleoid-associated protein YgaU